MRIRILLKLTKTFIIYLYLVLVCIEIIFLDIKLSNKNIKMNSFHILNKIMKELHKKPRTSNV